MLLSSIINLSAYSSYPTDSEPLLQWKPLSAALPTYCTNLRTSDLTGNFHWHPDNKRKPRSPTILYRTWIGCVKKGYYLGHLTLSLLSSLSSDVTSVGLGGLSPPNEAEAPLN